MDQIHRTCTSLVGRRIIRIMFLQTPTGKCPCVLLCFRCKWLKKIITNFFYNTKINAIFILSIILIYFLYIWKEIRFWEVRIVNCIIFINLSFSSMHYITLNQIGGFSWRERKPDWYIDTLSVKLHCIIL